MLIKDNNASRVIHTSFKRMGITIGIIGIASVIFKDYWAPILTNYLLSTGLSGSDVQYYMYLVGFFPLICAAVGGYLMYRSRLKPLHPTKEEIDEGKF